MQAAVLFNGRDGKFQLHRSSALRGSSFCAETFRAIIFMSLQPNPSLPWQSSIAVRLHHSRETESKNPAALSVGSAVVLILTGEKETKQVVRECGVR